MREFVVNLEIRKFIKKRESEREREREREGERKRERESRESVLVNIFLLEFESLYFPFSLSLSHITQIQVLIFSLLCGIWNILHHRFVRL